MDSTAAAHQSDSEHPADGGSGSYWLRVDVIASPATGMVRLAVTGELDRMTAEYLQQQVVLALRGQGPATLEIDAAGLSFLDSSGVRSLLACRDSAEAAGSRLVVTNPARIPYQVLEISGLLELFAVTPNPALAITTGRQRNPGRQTPKPLTPQQVIEQAQQLRQAARETCERARAISSSYPWRPPTPSARPHR